MRENTRPGSTPAAPLLKKQKHTNPQGFFGGPFLMRIFRERGDANGTETAKGISKIERLQADIVYAADIAL